MRGRIARMLALVALVTLGLAGCAQGTTAAASTPPKTLEQVGGVRIVVSVSASQDASSLKALVARAQRGLGVKDASARTSAGSFTATQIVVDLPGYTDLQLAESALTTQGDVRIIDTGGNPLTVGATVGAQQYPTLFTGAQVDPASVAVQTDIQSGQPIVTFAFKGAAASQFAQYTGSHIGSYLTITLDNRVIESATIQSQIAGLAQIIGMTMAQAQTLAACLKSAPLPGPVSLVSETVVIPSGA